MTIHEPVLKALWRRGGIVVLPSEPNQKEESLLESFIVVLLLGTITTGVFVAVQFKVPQQLQFPLVVAGPFLFSLGYNYENAYGN